MLAIVALVVVGAPFPSALHTNAGPTPHTPDRPHSSRGSSRLMATLPAGAVDGLEETLLVFEDLRHPGAPIVYRGATLHFTITKSGESIAVENETALWGGRRAADVMEAKADVLGNELVRDGEPKFEDVARLLPPVLATQNLGVHTDFSLDTQSFVGSRIASEKRAFSATGAGAACVKIHLVVACFAD